MIMLHFLKSLSFSGAENLLLQEGYIPSEYIEKSSSTYDRVFQYPYSLYDNNGTLTDTVYFVEYCIETEDHEYLDGRMTWEVLQTEWIR